MVTRLCRSNNWDGSRWRLRKTEQSWFINGEMGSRTYIHSENGERLAKRIRRLQETPAIQE